MATISARVDDQLKAEAESVADAIGIPLSTAINIFLKRFSANRGFPFDVVAPSAATAPHLMSQAELERSVKSAVADLNNTGHVDHFTYIDPATGKLITENLAKG